MDLKEIQNLIKFVAKSGTSEVKLEMDDFKITIKTGSAHFLDSRQINTLKTKNKNIFIVTNNNSNPLLFQIKQE